MIHVFVGLLKGDVMRKIITSLLVVTLLLSACQADNSVVQNENENKINVITSFYPLALITEELGGENVNVTSVYPTDSDPHSYELTGKQSADIANSDLVIATDEHEDSALIGAANSSNTPIITITDEPSFQNQFSDQSELNAHVWTTPANAIIIAEIISEWLAQFDATNAQVYADNLKTMKSNLKALDEQYQQFANEQSKTIVIAHDAYLYYRLQYGIDYVSLYGEHHDDEPTTKDIKNVIDLINKQQINTIFVEQNDVDNSVMKQISNETNTNLEVFYNLATPSSIKQFATIEQYYEYNLQLLQLGQQ